MTTKVHQLIVYVVDHDKLGADEVKNVLENARYPNRCIHPVAVALQTREVEWHDNHPINMTATSRKALEELFDTSDVKTVAECAWDASLANGEPDGFDEWWRLHFARYQ